MPSADFFLKELVYLSYAEGEDPKEVYEGINEGTFKDSIFWCFGSVEKRGGK